MNHRRINTASVDLPLNLPPSYNGRNTRVEYVGLAGLDMKGNDPDRGWRPISVS